MVTNLPVAVLTDMTGAVTTKYENQHPVKVQTSSFSYKLFYVTEGTYYMNNKYIGF
jgi:hypothetical protein